MTDIRELAAPTPPLLDDYVCERELAAVRAVGLRALRAERQRGDGPPWIKLGRDVYCQFFGFKPPSLDGKRL